MHNVIMKQVLVIQWKAALMDNDYYLGSEGDNEKWVVKIIMG